ncbi:MAG TPA: fused MFS/spermidine synthase, partial [Caballeronia sp.]|nr:fused MFS/spermidine synthase [Caballeronia sp.]
MARARVHPLFAQRRAPSPKAARQQPARKAVTKREPSSPQKPIERRFGTHHKFYWIFAVSGFSGLIYESIWTHYLKLFLGHAAYAQSLVLAIFMGGMALGAWLCGRLSQRWRNLLLGYAIVEGLIGFLALIFHPLFVSTVDLTLNQLIPSLGSSAEITAVKWSIGAALILPQSVLLGMTFPLMSAGLIRRFPDRPGSRIATLYFANSIGGAIGVLASGFWLIRLVGLPGTVGIAGGLNIVLAMTVAALARGPSEPVFQKVEHQDEKRDHAVPLALMLAVAGLTGLSSFMYEIGWIRMLSLVLGSSTHAFELMLSAFILGLALGGLWVRRRIDSIASPTVFLGWVQVVMGLCAVATLPLYNLSFDAMQALVSVLPKTEAGYTQFNLASHAIASVIMLPAAVCAGMTLPLITYALIRSGIGERSIGLVYGANTVGAIVGVLFAVHIGMPLLGLKNLIVTGAAVDIALGVLLLASCVKRVGMTQAAVAAAVAVLVLGVSLTLVSFDPYRMVSGVFRGSSFHLMSADSTKVLFNRDGKTATISLLETADKVVQVRTNGKSDASI